MKSLPPRPRGVRCFPSIRGLLLLTCLALPLGWAPFQMHAQASPGRVEQVVIVFKTHFDIGYTDMASNVVQRYRTTMIDQALAVVDQNRDLPPDRQFVWTLPGWPLSRILADWPGQTAARQQRLRDAFQQGRFVVHALPFTTHTELLEPEDLVRGLRFASTLCRQAGLPLPRDAKMTDVPSHSWMLPTLLRQAGVDFLHLGCNAASRSPEVPALFWWEGPDGSRLLTMYTAESYGTGLVPPKDWPYRTWLALIHTGDNHGPPTPDEVRKLLAEAAEKLPGIRVRIGRLSDFADAIIAERAAVPVVRGDMPDTWIHGPMSDPGGAHLARRTRPDIATTEALGTELRAWGAGGANGASAVPDAYEQSLLYGEHTWGGAYWWIYGKYQQFYGEKWQAERAAGRFDRIESSWAEHTAYIESANRLIEPALAGELDSLAAAVKVNGSRLVVFNPLPWERDDLATVPASLPADRILVPADGGPGATLVRWSDGTRQFVARKLPPLGYRTFRLVTGQPAVPSCAPISADPALRGAALTAKLDPARGQLASLIDRRAGRELLDPTGPGFSPFLYERFSADEVGAFVKAYVKINADWATNELGKPDLPPAATVPYRAESVAGSAAVIERTPAADRAVFAAPARNGAPRLEYQLTLWHELPFAELELTVHDKPADPWPEAGWLALAFPIEQPQFRLGRLGGIVDPARDLVPGSNHHLFGLDTGLTVRDARGAGVGLCALDDPLVSLDVPGGWRYARDFVPRRARVYVNLFNNQWTTNFRLWNQGTWTSRFRLWPVARGARDEQALTTPSLAARFPLRTAWCDGPAGSLPPTRAGLTLSRPGVRVTAFGPNPDGPGTVLRLWEYAGQAGRCRVRLPEGMSAETIQPVDLRGQRRGEPIRVRDGRFEVELKPFAPASFVLP